MTFGYLAQQGINAAQVAALYALLSVSYVMIHAVTRRINFAFGAFAILAGYTFIASALWLMVENPAQPYVALVLAAAIAVGHAAIAGVASEAVAVRPVVRESSLAVLVTTLGLAVAIDEATRIAHGSRDRWLPPLFNETLVIGAGTTFPVHVSAVQAVVILAAIALATGLMLFIRRHPFGRAWRATSEDPRMAELSGIDSGRVFRISYLIAITFAATAGVLVALLYGVASHSGGFVIGLKTLFIAVVGGLGSIGGTFLAAILLAVFETFWSAWMGPDYRDAAAFLVLTLLMIRFPEGLAERSRRAEPV